MPKEPALPALRTTSLPLDDAHGLPRILASARQFAEEAAAREPQAFVALVEEHVRRVQRLPRESASLILSARGSELWLSWDATSVRLPVVPPEPARITVVPPPQSPPRSQQPPARPVGPPPEVRVHMRGWGWLPEPRLQAVLLERPHPREQHSGDSALIERHGSRLRLAVVDGLGHGPAAREAAVRTATSLTSSFRDELQDSVLAAHDTVATTRGATLGVADIDLATRNVRATTVGNVRVAMFFGGGRTWSPCGTDAVLGHGRGTLHGRLAVRVEQHPVPSDTIFALFSDGLQNQLRLPMQRMADLSEMALTLFATYSVPNDDATLLLVSCG